MEQKRTIWITLAAGIFLLVVIGAAVILYKGSAVKTNTTTLVENNDIWVTPNPLPSNNTDSTKSYYSGFATQETNQTIQEDQSSVLQDLDSDTEQSVTDIASTEQNQVSSLSSDSLTVYATGNTTIYPTGTTTIDLTSSAQTNVTAQNQTAKNAMEETEKAKAAASVKAETTTTKTSDNTKTVEKAASSKATNTKSTASNTSAKASKTTTTQATSKNTTSTTKAVEKTPDRFWVQAASYTSVKNADEARAILESKKIQCEVFTYTDEKGTIYYRVRVGPYTTKSEAEYWKSKIDAIDLFAKNGTYITNSSASK